MFQLLAVTDRREKLVLILLWRQTMSCMACELAEGCDQLGLKYGIHHLPLCRGIQSYIGLGM